MHTRTLLQSHSSAAVSLRYRVGTAAWLKPIAWWSFTGDDAGEQWGKGTQDIKAVGRGNEELSGFPLVQTSSVTLRGALTSQQIQRPSRETPATFVKTQQAERNSVKTILAALQKAPVCQAQP